MYGSVLPLLVAAVAVGVDDPSVPAVEVTAGAVLVAGGGVAGAVPVAGAGGDVVVGAGCVWVWVVLLPNGSVYCWLPADPPP